MPCVRVRPDTHIPKATTIDNGGANGKDPRFDARDWQLAGPLGATGSTLETRLFSVRGGRLANERGERLIWLEPPVIDRLTAMRGLPRATAT